MTDAVHAPTIPAIATGRRLHPLLHALRWIAADLVSTLAFVGLYAVSRSALVATLAGLAAGIAQIGWLKMKGGRPDAIQWLSLALVAVFGGAALLTHDPRFVMIKPSLIYAMIGAAMLERGWMTRYMPEVVLACSGDLVVTFGYVWAGAMFATALLNLAFVAAGDRTAWSGFIAIFPIASKIALVTIQYVTTRRVTVARMRRAASGQDRLHHGASASQPEVLQP